MIARQRHSRSFFSQLKKKKKKKKRMFCVCVVGGCGVGLENGTDEKKKKKKKTFTHANYRKTQLDKREKVRPDVPLLNPYWKLLLFHEKQKIRKREKHVYTYL